MSACSAYRSAGGYSLPLLLAAASFSASFFSGSPSVMNEEPLNDPFRFTELYTVRQVLNSALQAGRHRINTVHDLLLVLLKLMFAERNLNVVATERTIIQVCVIASAPCFSRPPLKPAMGLKLSGESCSCVILGWLVLPCMRCAGFVLLNVKFNLAIG